jgi:hypothetical protein
MAAAVILLCMILMYFMAYTTAVRRTMRALGLLRPKDSERRTEGSSFHAIILLGIYLIRLNTAFVLGAIVYFITSRASTWYYGVGIVLLCWIGSVLIGSMPWLRLDRAEMVAVLIADLERRRDWYRRTRDGARLGAVEELLLRIRAVQTMPAARGRNG